MATNQQAASTRQLAGVIGFFDGPNALIAATEKVRDAKYRYFDAFTPYPIHGLDAAQGLKRSPLPYVTFGAGITGTSLAFLFQYWTSAIDWPLIVGGKPFNSWPAFVPIMFELTILFAGLSTVAAMFIINGLPNLRRKSFDPGITRDRFALMIESSLPVDEDDEDASDDAPDGTSEVVRADGYKKFDEKEAQEFLKQAGAKEVRSVYSEGWF